MNKPQPTADYQLISSSELYDRLDVLKCEQDALLAEIEHRRLAAGDADHKRRNEPADRPPKS